MASKKKKITTAIVAGVTAVALLLGGTFAWQSINQTALNEVDDVVNPGGRLHDDFNGSNKDVYVENFADENIFARIRLEEFFEITQAGGTVHKIAGTRDENGNVAKYVLHDFYNKNATDDYWNWQTGGSTVFMPTFNKNKDSLVADVNGTYNGKDGIVTNDADDDRYSDNVEYYFGQKLSGDAIYDYDSNGADEVGSDFNNLGAYSEHVTTVTEEHTAKNTLTATLISMDEWVDLGSQRGNYWVYDTDGWVYWAAPIEPGEATGLLLDGISLKDKMDDSWYYAINVIAQFVTENDLGAEDGSGFYDESAGTAPTDNAVKLLKQIGAITEESEETVSTLNDVNVSYGKYALFGTTNKLSSVTYSNGEDYIDLTVKDWKLDSDIYTEGTSIDAATGDLTISKDEPYSYIGVSGTVSGGEYDGYVFTSYVNVFSPWLEIIEVDENGEELPASSDYIGIIEPGKTNYYKVSNVVIYGAEWLPYPGFENTVLNSTNVEWNFYGEYPFELTEGTYTSAWNEDGTIYSVTHTCEKDTCKCAVVTHLEAKLISNSNVSGFITNYLYDDATNVDTMHLYVSYNDSEDVLHQKMYSDGTHDITVKLSSRSPYINFDLGEFSTGVIQWADAQGNIIATDEGLVNEIEGISDLHSVCLTLDTNVKIEELVLKAKYDTTIYPQMSSETEITFNFKFVWEE